MAKCEFDIICFGPDWYKPSFTSSMQIMQHLSAGRRLLWVNPIPVRLPAGGGGERRAFWRKVVQKLRTHLRLLHRVRPGFWIFSPLYLPAFLSDRGVRANAALLAVQVACLRRLLGMGRVLIWATGTYHPLFVARRLRPWRFFYHYADKNSAFTDLPAARASELRERYESYDRALLAAADRVYCASLAIHRDLTTRLGKDPKITYLPHGVDFEHFHGVRERDLPLPEVLRDLPHPVIGYFGTLTNRSDMRILRALTERHPDWSIVLIGRVVGDYSTFAEHPNICFTGAVPYADLPRYAQVFDLGIMHWIQTEWITNSFPVKAQEYLALGIPVVSIPIRQVEEEFGDLVSIASDPDRFVTLVEEELLADNATKRHQRAERVRERDWSRVADRIVADLEATP